MTAITEQIQKSTSSFISKIFSKGGPIMQGYCVKCRTKREMQNPRPTVMKNGRPATKGNCPVCGTQMFRIGKA